MGLKMNNFQKLLALLLLSPLAFAETTETKFSLSCKITDQVLLQSIDGIPKRFSVFTDGFENGDTANLDFEFTEYPAIGSYGLVIKNEDMKMSILLNYYYSEAITNGLQYEWFGKTQMLQEGWFNLAWRAREITARRYYKNDWHIMFHFNGGVAGASQLMTANCMQMPKEWDEVIEKIKLFDKEKWGVLLNE